MIEFLRKFETRSIKIARVNSILITKSINFQLFILILYCVGGPLWSKAIFRAQSIYREVYDFTFIFGCDWHYSEISNISTSEILARLQQDRHYSAMCSSDRHYSAMCSSDRHNSLMCSSDRHYFAMCSSDRHYSAMCSSDRHYSAMFSTRAPPLWDTLITRTCSC